MPEESQNRSCSVCGKGVIDTGNGVAHVGGGEVTQRCRNCGFTGGQIGRFVECPRCGDGTQLDDDHVAS